MKKEMAHDLWRVLYSLSAELKELEPWKELCDVDLIGVQEPDWEEPVFFSILGKQGECYGIVGYRGTPGLAAMQQLLECEEDPYLLRTAMAEQEALVCYWGNREEVPPDQYREIKKLGFHFRGRGQWPYFLSMEPYYMADTPDTGEAEILAAAYVHLIDAIKALREGRVKVDFAQGEYLLVSFDEKGKSRMMAAARLPYVEVSYSPIQITDELLLRRLKNQPVRPIELMMDIAYLPGAVKDSERDKMSRIRIFLCLDRSSGSALCAELLEQEGDEIDIMMDFLLSWIEEEGRPVCILARQMIVLDLLKDVCKELNIKLKKERLPQIDQFLKGLECRL